MIIIFVFSCYTVPEEADGAGRGGGLSDTKMSSPPNLIDE